MSLPKNKFEEKISAIILCAGEGKRISNFIQSIPKPLIEVNNKPLLMHIISNLNAVIRNLGFTINLDVITGHFGYKIEKYISSIKTKNPSLHANLSIINSGNEYKKGPLYSFLSITKEKRILKKGKIYLIIPGDTYFELDIFTVVFKTIVDNFTTLQTKPIIFYQKKKGKTIKSQLNSKKLVSIVNLEKKKSRTIVKSIHQMKLKGIDDNEEVTQILPLFIFNYKLISRIIDIERKLSINTIREIINYIIQQEKFLFYAKSIDSKYMYFDIDTKQDFLKIEKKKGQ